MSQVQPEQQAPERSRGLRKVRTGRVVSDRMEKTVIVQVPGLKSHPLYKKVMRQRTRFKVHDESDQCQVGDLVRIMETRPISKDKRWRVLEVVEKAR
ncbi:MAG: 30S ribosomal protein S17 [Candidatus Dormibacteraeota bacterium]|nr:30S ribosomal protein S17 [Candidatus Dormibacteraeota bacterium]